MLAGDVLDLLGMREIWTEEASSAACVRGLDISSSFEFVVQNLLEAGFPGSVW
jgi:hypothetical protein